MKSFNNCQYVNTKNNYYHLPGVSYSQKIDSNFNQKPPLYELGPKDSYQKPYYTYTIGYTGEPEHNANLFEVGTKMQGNDGSIYVVVRDFGKNIWMFDECQCKDTFNYCADTDLAYYSEMNKEIKKESEENLCQMYNSQQSCNDNNSLVYKLKNNLSNCEENLTKYCDINNNCGCFETNAELIRGIDYNCKWKKNNDNDNSYNCEVNFKNKK
jgi:hypothetical protein